MNESTMCPHIFNSRHMPGEGRLKAHESKRRGFHVQEAWKSALLPKDKRKAEDTEKSTTPLGSIGEGKTQGKPWLSGDRKGNTGNKAFLEHRSRDFSRTHHFLKLTWNIQQKRPHSGL